MNGKQGSVSASMKVQNLCHTQCKFLSPQQKLSQLVVSTDEFAFDANYSDFDMHYEVLNVQTDKIASPSGGKQRRMNEPSLGDISSAGAVVVTDGSAGLDRLRRRWSYIGVTPRHKIRSWTFVPIE